MGTLVFPEEMLIILLFEGNDLREDIRLEFLVFLGFGILIGPLLKRDISADKLSEEDILLIKTMDNGK